MKVLRMLRGFGLAIIFFSTTNAVAETVANCEMDLFWGLSMMDLSNDGHVNLGEAGMASRNALIARRGNRPWEEIRKYDYNRDGQVTLSDYYAVRTLYSNLRRIPDYDPNPAVCQRGYLRIFAAMDPDKDGSLNRADYLNFVNSYVAAYANGGYGRTIEPKYDFFGIGYPIGYEQQLFKNIFEAFQGK